MRLEVALFGFEAGTFTDAKRGNPGLFAPASRNTLRRTGEQGVVEHALGALPS